MRRDRANALRLAAWAAAWGDPDQRQRQLEESLALFRELGDRRMVGDVLDRLALHAWMISDYDQMERAGSGVPGDLPANRATSRSWQTRYAGCVGFPGTMDRQRKPSAGGGSACLPAERAETQVGSRRRSGSWAWP